MITTSRPRVSNDHAARLPVAVVLAVGLSVVAAFQTPRAFGAPLGAAALGGTDPGQPPTGWFAAVGLVAALLALVRGGYDLVLLPAAVPRVGMLVALLGAGPLMNVASSSPWERFGWGPDRFVLVRLGVVLARSDLPAGQPADRR